MMTVMMERVMKQTKGRGSGNTLFLFLWLLGLVVLSSLVLLASASASTSAPTYVRSTPSEEEELSEKSPVGGFSFFARAFEKWKRRHVVKFSDAEEEARRLEIFTSNLKFINRWNRNNKHTKRS